jgi:predicted secreted hydrolase
MNPTTDVSNLGTPLFVDPQKDLVAKADTASDSWYVLCNFRAGDREIGFEWHQMVIEAAPGVKITTTEFLLMDATRGIWLPHSAAEPLSDEIGAAADRCRVTSSFGTLEGDAQKLTLRLNAPDGALDLVLHPTEQILYNGTVGLLPLLGSRSFQYAFPNMRVEGTVRLNDETFEVRDTTAWLDRQWADASTLMGEDLPSWVWIGMTLNPERTAALSLWDTADAEGRRVFGTILDEKGVQSNHLAHLTHGQIWTGERTGNSYPGTLELSIPTADLELSFQALLERPEFDQGEGREAISGCQSPCAVKGHYGSILIDRVTIVEMIGDVHGMRAGTRLS